MSLKNHCWYYCFCLPELLLILLYLQNTSSDFQQRRKHVRSRGNKAVNNPFSSHRVKTRPSSRFCHPGGGQHRLPQFPPHRHNFMGHPPPHPSDAQQHLGMPPRPPRMHQNPQGLQEPRPMSPFPHQFGGPPQFSSPRVGLPPLPDIMDHSNFCVSPPPLPPSSGPPVVCRPPPSLSVPPPSLVPMHRPPFCPRMPGSYLTYGMDTSRPPPPPGVPPPSSSPQTQVPSFPFHMPPPLSLHIQRPPPTLWEVLPRRLKLCRFISPSICHEQIINTINVSSLWSSRCDIQQEPKWTLFCVNESHILTLYVKVKICSSV